MTQGRSGRRGPARQGAAPRKEPILPKPSPAGWAALGPYAHARLTVHALGLSLGLDVPVSVFSTQRIDEGTQLLLSHLPPRPPGRVLDLGCGYGALGLPVAARHPQAACLLVDRDLLAVRACAHNARALGLDNVQALPGLGFRDLPEGSAPFDWLLCNVPARIGATAIGHFLSAGRALLSPQGELRVVVIRDLRPVIEEQARALQLSGLHCVVEGPRHSVYALPAQPGPSQGPAAVRDPVIYSRDQTRLIIQGGDTLELCRPHDASEDPGHLEALSALFAALPRQGVASALAFRCGYGALPLVLRRLHPQARVVAQDRDLLDLTFLALNAAALGLSGPLLAPLPAVEPGAAEGPFDLVVGELSSSCGAAVAAQELRQVASLLAPRGQALILLTPRQEREWLPSALPKGCAAAVLLRRNDAVVLRIGRSPGREKSDP